MYKLTRNINFNKPNFTHNTMKSFNYFYIYHYVFKLIIYHTILSKR